MPEKPKPNGLARLWRYLSDRVFEIYTYWIPDRAYAKALYKKRLGRAPNLTDPRYFTEKLQVLKLHPQNVIYAPYADKLAVRKFVAQRIGEQYLNELYFVTDDVDAITEERLPDSFVLKATHGSGYNIVCRDKSRISLPEVRKTLRKWLRTDYARRKREYQYSNVKRQIICERYLEDESGALTDYKFMCFDGEPKLVQYHADRFGDHRVAIFTEDWVKTPAKREYPRLEREVSRPQFLEQMLYLSRQLSRGFPFVRVDFYHAEGRTIFGEMTFHPGSGFIDFEPEEWSLRFAEWITLPGNKK